MGESQLVDPEPGAAPVRRKPVGRHPVAGLPDGGVVGGLLDLGPIALGCPGLVSHVLCPCEILLGSLAREQFHDLYERGVPWRRGPGLPLSALGGLRPTPDRPVVGALGRCGWKVVRQVDHPRACRKMIVYISVSVMN